MQRDNAYRRHQATRIRRRVRSFESVRDRIQHRPEEAYAHWQQGQAYDRTRASDVGQTANANA